MTWEPQFCVFHNLNALKILLNQKHANSNYFEVVKELKPLIINDGEILQYFFDLQNARNKM